MKKLILTALCTLVISVPGHALVKEGACLRFEGGDAARGIQPHCVETVSLADEKDLKDMELRLKQEMINQMAKSRQQFMLEALNDPEFRKVIIQKIQGLQ